MNCKYSQDIRCSRFVCQECQFVWNIPNCKHREIFRSCPASPLENKCMSHKVATKFIFYPSELRTACDSVTPLVTPRFNNRFIFTRTTGHRRCKALIMCSLAPHTSDFGVRFYIQHIEMTFFTNSLTATWNETDPDIMQRVSHFSVWKMHLTNL